MISNTNQINIKGNKFQMDNIIRAENTYIYVTHFQIEIHNNKRANFVWYN